MAVMENARFSAGPLTFAVRHELPGRLSWRPRCSHFTPHDGGLA
jgi:hypothetical protein